MFNVNNPEDIKKGAKPNISEIGPFVYEEYREKVEIETDGDCSIKYAQYKRYDFNMDKTRELCKDCLPADTQKITIINAAYVGMINLLKEAYGKFMRKCLN